MIIEDNTKTVMICQLNEHSKISTILTKDQFSDFFRENYHVACLVALRYMADLGQAEDLVQDAFVVLWEKRETLQIKDNLKNYFFKIVRNSALKKVGRDKSDMVPLSGLLVDPAEEEEEERFDDEELAVEVYRAIGELPSACRTIFNLAYREKLTYQQIADQLNISKNTVKTQMGIAYSQLRNKLSKLIIVLLRIIEAVVWPLHIKILSSSLRTCYKRRRREAKIRKTRCQRFPAMKKNFIFLHPFKKKWIIKVVWRIKVKISLKSLLPISMTRIMVMQ
jgi:RNA polymerase sigma-70 factor (ECF subfamily)